MKFIIKMLVFLIMPAVFLFLSTPQVLAVVGLSVGNSSLNLGSTENLLYGNIGSGSSTSSNFILFQKNTAPLFQVDSAGNLSTSGSISANSFSGGSISATSVSAGDFGSAYSGGDYSFPGKVGIGTTTPSERLTVNGNISIPSNSDGLLLGANGALKLFNTVSGIYSDLNATTGLASQSLKIISSKTTFRLLANESSGRAYFQAGTTGGSNSGSLYFSGINGDTATLMQFAATNASFTGNLSIGTTTPNKRLTVVGDGTYSVNVGSNRIGNVAAPVDGLDAVNRSYLDSAIANATSSISSFWLGTGNNISNTNLGNVGIGLTNPSQKLDVLGRISLDDGKASVFVGKGAGINDDASDNYNTGIGFYSLNSNTTGFYNTAIGFYSLRLNTTGERNTALGFSSLEANTTGVRNSATGFNSLVSNTTGRDNTANGYLALSSNYDGGFNTALGSGSLQNNTSSYNTAAGYASLALNNIGSSNVAIGYASLTSNTTGSYNTVVGYIAGKDLTTGTYNTFIGSSAGYNANQLLSATNSMALGNGAYTTASNQVVIGNTNITQTLLNGKVGIGTTTPDKRLTVIGDGTYSMNVGSNRVGSLAAPVLGTDATNKDYVDTAVLNAGGGSSVWLASGNNISNINSGNVGIGITNPSQKLDMGGGNIQMSAGRIMFGGYTDRYLTDAYGFRLAGNATRPIQIYNTSLLVGYASAGEDRGAGNLFVQGNVGIGNTNPGATLEVTGSFRNSTDTIHSSLGGLGDVLVMADNSGKLFATSTAAFSGGGSGSGYEVNPSVHVVKNKNQTISGSAAIQNDDELFFDIGANETWSFRVVVSANSGTTPDLKFAATAPSGAACSYSAIDPEAGASTPQVNTCGTATALLAGNGAYDVYELVGTIRNGSTAGRVNFQWAQNTSTVSNTIVASDSFLDAYRVVGTSGVAKAFIQDGNSFGSSAKLGTTDNYNLSFLTNGNSRMTIDSSGNVGIGTTSPSTRLTVLGSGGYSISAGGDKIGGLASPSLGTDAANKSYVDTAVLNAGGGSSVWLASGNNISNTNSANVGVGLTNPAQRLDVSGKIAIDGTTIAYRPSSFQGTFVFGDGGTKLTAGGGSEGKLNTFVGYYAGKENTTGYQNTAVGSQTMELNVSGNNNTAIGHKALLFNTSGGQNTASGVAALSYNTTGASNAAFGYMALNANTTGNFNYAFGHRALVANDVGNFNIAIGDNSLVANTSGSYNLAIGSVALSANTTGQYNIAAGLGALNTNTTGSENIAVGKDAGRYLTAGGANATGTNSLFLGNHAKSLADGQTNQIVIGHDANGMGSNSVVLGNDSITKTVLKGFVGIGTTAPAGALQIGNGTVFGTSGFVPANANLILRGASNRDDLTSILSLREGLEEYGFDVGYYGLSNLFQINIVTPSSVNTALTIERDTYDVGIGTTNPAAKFHVNGSSIFTQAVQIGAPTAANHAVTRSYMESAISGAITGLSQSITVKGSSGANCTITYTNGLATATTCP